MRGMHNPAHMVRYACKWPGMLARFSLPAVCFSRIRMPPRLPLHPLTLRAARLLSAAIRLKCSRFQEASSTEAAEAREAKRGPALS